MKNILIIVLGVLLSIVNAKIAVAENRLRLATTTSTDNSGLLAVLLPAFKRAHGIDVYTIAVGTGKALRLGEYGDVDMVMVHAQRAEEAFVQSGFGLSREEIMYNYFLLVGPASDPANVLQAESAGQALARIEQRRALFVSRGDDSGTHKRERAIWQMADIEPEGVWYREAGQGMGKVLQIAGELGAYTLVDRGTWLKLGELSGLRELYSAGSLLYNPYSVIAVSPEVHSHVNVDAAEKFSHWLKSPNGQRLIDSYRIKGKRAFVPLHLDAFSNPY